jgi:hypothetical protein
MHAFSWHRAIVDLGTDNRVTVRPKDVRALLAAKSVLAELGSQYAPESGRIGGIDAIERHPSRRPLCRISAKKTRAMMLWR